MTASKIEWTATRNPDGSWSPGRSDWNPLRGCTRVSPGCERCYAEAIASRFSGPGQPFHGFAERTGRGPRWTRKVELIEERLTAPMRWRKPARIFALSMSDLFHEAVPDEWIDRIFAVMALCPQHTFMVLTKRAERMRDYTGAFATPGRIGRELHATAEQAKGCAFTLWQAQDRLIDWPLPNVMLGVSVEDQRRACERVPILFETPAALHWISAEPLLGPVDLGAPLFPNEVDRRGTLIGGAPYPGDAWRRLGWIVIGGESGPGARPFNIEWARSIIAQCRKAGIACFVKQLGAVPIIADLPPFNGSYNGKRETGFPDGTFFGNRTGRRELNGLQALLRHRKGGAVDEWPPDLIVRQYPASGHKASCF